MKITIPIRIAIGAASLFVLWQGVHTFQGKPKEPIQTQKDPHITASEQYAFVECKRMSGEYKDYHYEDMLRVLNSYGIPESILKTQKVKDLANQQIESGSCDFFSGHGRITDMAGDPKDSVASYRKLSGWQLYSVNMFAEAECMMSTGELSSRKEQERIVGEKISENEGLFDGVDENQLTSFLKSNLSTIAWAAQQKKSKKDCRYQLKP